MSLVYEKAYDNYHDLAKAINGIPENHDDREMVIADMIKKYVHGEKYRLYRNLTRWKGAGLDWIFKRIIEPKMESHKEFFEKWCYNTPYSISNYGKDQSKIVPTAMSKALEDLGATVTITRS